MLLTLIRQILIPQCNVWILLFLSHNLFLNAAYFKVHFLNSVCVCGFHIRGRQPAGLVLCRGRREPNQKAETPSAASTNACGHVKTAGVQGQTFLSPAAPRELLTKGGMWPPPWPVSSVG